MKNHAIDRRAMMSVSSAALAGAFVARTTAAADEKKLDEKKPTQFQIACMTLPFARFPLARALEGIKSAGYRYVAWGTEHNEEGGKRVPVMATDAAPEKGRELGKRCRDVGLEPLMMFSTIYPENPKAMEVFTNRIRQAQAGGVAHVLTFGHTKGGDRKLWVERFKKLGPVAKDHGVMIVIKQHGGDTGTGEACGEIVREIDHESVRVNYDAGNVMDYLSINPLPDLAKCVELVRSFCIKDHRDFPKDEDCGPGYGEIDHYRLLHAVAWTGLAMPLCCENIFAPLVPRPDKPEGVDALASRAREFLETIVAGLHGKSE
jgi:sugar phosphate isomerase/epimerase